jgi:threonine dehydratase
LDLGVIRDAESRIRPYVLETPLIYSKRLSELARVSVFLKLETLQPIGVFKIRGAFNRLLTLTTTERAGGVVTASSGNHGIAVACAAATLGIPAKIFVPTNANPEKVEVIQSHGAHLTKVGFDYHDSYTKAVEYSRSTGKVFVHAYDDLEVIAGQGTTGLEIARQCPDANRVIVPVGGGGLISGIAAALKQIKLDIRIVGVQASGARAVYDSWANGRIVQSDSPDTIADGLASRRPGENTFRLMREHVDEMQLVTDDELKRAITIYMKQTRLIVEPAGAASLAALLWHSKPGKEQKIVVVVSGGNISRSLLQELSVNY